VTPPHTTYAAFPFALVAIMLVWALRYAGASAKGGVPPPMVVSAPGADTWAVLFWFVRAIAQLSIGVLAWRAWFHDEPFGSELWVIAVLAFGWPLVVGASIRLGLVRTTYALAWFVRPYGTWSDASVSTLAFATRALRHSRSRESSAAWIESKLRSRWQAPRGLLALAELAAACGDDARRRMLVATFDGLEPPRGWFYVSRALASRSLARQARRAHMADLLDAGRWFDAVPLGATSRDPFAWTLSNALRRLGGGVTVPPWKLRLGAAFAGRATWAYARAALRSVPIESAQDPFSLTDLSRARPYALTPGALAHAWDVWFADPVITRALEERSQTLGCRSTEMNGLAVLRVVAAASVVALVELGGGTSGDDGLHRLAVDAVWERRQSAVVDGSERFPVLTFDDMERAWIEWITLKALWRDAVMVADRLRRRWLFERCWAKVLNHAVLAHNKHGQRAFASDVYRFLLTEAKPFMHSSIDLLEKNVRAAGS
jgi:hypothetical protein